MFVVGIALRQDAAQGVADGVGTVVCRCDDGDFQTCVFGGLSHAEGAESFLFLVSRVRMRERA